MSTIDTEQRLGILIPAGKNINPEITKLLGYRGIKTGEGRRNGRLHGIFENFPGRWTQLPSANIMEEVAYGRIFQAAFVGSDFEAEYRASLPKDTPPKVEMVDRFDLFPEHVRVSLLVRDGQAKDYYESFDGEEYDVTIQRPSDLRCRRLLTRYPELTREFLRPHFPKDEKAPVDIDTRIAGKEEGMVSAHAADATVVIVESGGTMRRNGLMELAVIEDNVQPIYVVNRAAVAEQGKEHLLDEFSDRLQNRKRGSNRFVQPFEAVANNISTVGTTGSALILMIAGITSSRMMMGMKRK